MEFAKGWRLGREELESEQMKIVCVAGFLACVAGGVWAEEPSKAEKKEEVKLDVAEETVAKGAARALLERWRTWSRAKGS